MYCYHACFIYLSVQCIALLMSETKAPSVLMFILFLFGWINVYSLVIPLVSIMIGLPIVYSACTMMALVNFKDKATGSAVMSFITMGIAFLASCLLIAISSEHAITMPCLFLIITILAILVFWDAKRRYSEAT